MATQIIRVPGVSTNPNLPKFYTHNLLTKGSLLLVELAHPDCQIQLIDNSVVPNLAKKTAMSLCAATEAQVSGLFRLGSTGTSHVFEKTSSGALHGIVSPNRNNFTTHQNGGGITFQQSKILTYMKANPTNLFFIGFKGRVTRGAGENDTTMSPSVQANMFAVSGTSFSNDFLAVFQTNATLPTTPRSFAVPNPLPSRAANNQARLDFVRYVNVNGQVNGAINNISLLDICFGRTTFGNNVYPSAFSNYPSWILHNIYIEDLTVSGKTFAETAAKYEAYHNASVAEGGAYYNETFTSPSTLA